jgi:hypothetical protein
MYRIDPARADLAREYKARPNGPHGAELQKLLLILRWGSTRGKTVILTAKSERQWRLAKFGPKRGTPMQEYGPTFKTAAEANWACFRARWLETTGHECPVE